VSKSGDKTRSATASGLWIVLRKIRVNVSANEVNGVTKIIINGIDAGRGCGRVFGEIVLVIAKIKQLRIINAGMARGGPGELPSFFVQRTKHAPCFVWCGA